MKKCKQFLSSSFSFCHQYHLFRADVAEYGFNRQSDCNPKCSDSTSKDRIVKKYIVS